MTAFALGTASRPERWYQRRIDAHFRGRGSPGRDRELRAHLPTCEACRAYYDRHLHLADVDPQVAVPVRERLARGLGLPSDETAPPRRRFVMTLSAAVACAAAAILVVGLRAPTTELQPRGAGALPGSQLLVYELRSGAPPQPVVAEVRRESGLAFAYANMSRKRHLLVFAVDEGRRVYWYHPTWRSLQEDPVAIDIVRDDAIHEIPAAITHKFAGQRLQLFGVFLDDALSARQVEALVARASLDAQGRPQLSVAGAEVTRLDLRLVGDR